MVGKLINLNNVYLWFNKLKEINKIKKYLFKKHKSLKIIYVSK